MAQRIAAAIAGNKALVTEAGTSTGKTFAYLVPALLSGGKVIVSTGTKTLQDQLFNRPASFFKSPPFRSPFRDSKLTTHPHGGHTGALPDGSCGRLIPLSHTK